MTRTRPLSTMLALTALAGLAVPLGAQSFARKGEQDQARQQMLDGQVMPLSIIKRRVVGQVGDQMSYVGVDPSPRNGVYRLRFMRPDGKVVLVDVDGKTGEIIARSK